MNAGRGRRGKNDGMGTAGGGGAGAAVAPKASGIPAAGVRHLPVRQPVGGSDRRSRNGGTRREWDRWGAGARPRIPPATGASGVGGRRPRAAVLAREAMKGVAAASLRPSPPGCDAPAGSLGAPGRPALVRRPTSPGQVRGIPASIRSPPRAILPVRRLDEKSRAECEEPPARAAGGLPIGLVARCFLARRLGAAGSATDPQAGSAGARGNPPGRGARAARRRLALWQRFAR